MKSTKFFVSGLFVLAVLFGQVKTVLAAPDVISGTIQSITLETNTNTAVTTVLITLSDKEVKKTVRVTIESAIALGLVSLGGDGNPVINEAILGKLIEIEPVIVINDELHQHPVGDALATFFSDIPDLGYEAIMAVHNEGTGFGVIAQALWMTRKLGGDTQVFLAIIDAKKSKDFSAFVLEDGTTPANWGQFKQAVLNGKKGKPGIVIVKTDNPETGNGKDNDNGNNKDKKDKENNGQANGKDK